MNIMECIKQVSNFTNIATNLKLDNSKFDPKFLEKILPDASPKLEEMFKNIDKIDPLKKYKHCIYIDFKGIYAKIVAAAFIAKGYNLSYDKHQKPLDENELLKHPGKNFLFLSSSTIYGKPFGVRLRKNLMNVFNSRPDNIEGNLIRFIVLDSGFKEGLDCFDIKFVHILQNLATPSEQKQAIGRSTRMCGQMGLVFNSKRGWPLHVYKYDVLIPDSLKEKYDSNTLFDLFMKKSNIDIRKIILANQFEKIIAEAAADKELTKTIHNFSINSDTSISTKPVPPDYPKPEVAPRSFKYIVPGGKGRQLLHKQRGIIQKNKDTRGYPHPPTIKRTLNGVSKFVYQNFNKYKWEKTVLENKCQIGTSIGGTGEPIIVDLTPSQNFMRYYFQPSSVYKGILANWSTGSGKTCLGVAVASTSWEKKGYTILWVTRHTLKVDIWKNMFNQVCSLVVKDQIEKGDLKYPLKKGLHNYRSNAWVEPISFKQLSNLCEGRNEIYREMVKRNGARDPLRKTLIILDEAHKLFANDVTGSERPDTPAIIKAIHDSYKLSKENSVRVLLMTATPYTSDPMEFVKLMNIIREENEQIPETFEEFRDEYLTDNGVFKESSREDFMDSIAGQISYLNREKDARQFAYPVFHTINVAMSRSNTESFDNDIKKNTNEIEMLKDTIEMDKNECKKLPVKQRKECKDKIKEDENKMKELKKEVRKLQKDKKTAAENDRSQETALKKCRI